MFYGAQRPGWNDAGDPLARCALPKGDMGRSHRYLITVTHNNAVAAGTRRLARLYATDNSVVRPCVNGRKMEPGTDMNDLLYTLRDVTLLLTRTDFFGLQVIGGLFSERARRRGCPPIPSAWDETASILAGHPYRTGAAGSRRGARQDTHAVRLPHHGCACAPVRICRPICRIRGSLK